MNRRDFVLGATGAIFAGWRTAPAQQRTMPVLGYLSSGSPDSLASVIAAFRRGLGEAGYFEGQNVAIEYRWAKGRYDRLPALASDLVGRKIDLIVSGGGTPAARAAKEATSAIPVIFAGVGDPVGAGLVTSLARPEGNLTGFSILAAELTPKRLELLSELVPRAKIVALLINTRNAANNAVITELQEVARARDIRLPFLTASTETEIDAAFASLVQLGAEALVVGADPFFDNRREQLVALAARHALPAIYFERAYASAGGLVSYGPSLTAVYRQLGIYAGKVLKGARPSELPVEQPTKFELVVNLKTARVLGIAVPQSLLLRADEVIE